MAQPSLLPSFVRLRVEPLIPDKGKVWLVGGAVRDHFLHRDSYDFDFAVDGDAIGLAKGVADRLGGAYYDLDHDRGTGRILLTGESARLCLDFAGLRGEGIEADLRGRDFTLNALAVSLASPGELLDPTGGLRDIKEGLIRACAAHSVRADPVRALRGIRLASEIEFRIEPDTIAQIKAAASSLPRVSAERNRDELFNILGAPSPAQALRVLHRLGLLAVLCPEAAGLRDGEKSGVADLPEVSFSTIERLIGLLRALGRVTAPEAAAQMVLAQVSLRLGRFREPLQAYLEQETGPGRTRRSVLFLGALYLHVGEIDVSGENVAPVGERSARLAARRARRLKLSAAEVRQLDRMVRGYARVEDLEAEGSVGGREIYRFFRDSGEAGIDATLLELADTLARHVSPVPQSLWEARVELARRLLEAYFERYEELIAPPPLVRGDEIIQAFRLQPGPIVGQMLESVREAQAAGEVTSKQAAMALVAAALDGADRSA